MGPLAFALASPLLFAFGLLLLYGLASALLLTVRVVCRGWPVVSVTRCGCDDDGEEDDDDDGE